MKMKTQETKMCGIQVKQCFEEIHGIIMLILEKSDLQLMTLYFYLEKIRKKKINPTVIINNKQNNRNKTENKFKSRKK